jgi:hypothetical protein
MNNDLGLEGLTLIVVFAAIGGLSVIVYNYKIAGDAEPESKI